MTLLKFVGGTILLLLALLIIPMLGTIFGAVTAIIVSFFWPTTFAAALAHFGLAAFAPYQIGAILGFIGGFFRVAILRG